MVDDALKLTIDTIFDDQKGQNTSSPYVLQHYENNENLWEFIVDLKKANS